MGASVKIMLSYNYCHFEVSKSVDVDLSNEEINEMRKEVQRLADEAVRQYQVAKEKESLRSEMKWERDQLERQVRAIEKIPGSEWTPEMKARVKSLQDNAYWRQHDYDYEDGI